MSKKTIVFSVMAVSIAALTFICESASAQSAQDLINQMRALRNQSQAPSGSNNNQNAGPTAYQLRAEEHNRRIDAANEKFDKGWEAYKQGDYAAALAYFQSAEDEDGFKGFRKAIDMTNAAIDNHKGVEAEQRGDYAAELDYFQKANALFPSDIYRKNIAIAKQEIAGQHQQQATGAIIQETVQNFAQNLSSSSGTPSDNANKGSSLDFTDPNVVDATNRPTGLPKDVENSIPATPAGDRVRKGLQAIQAHDWKVALAWFQDALNKQPGDPGLERLVDLAQYTLQKQSQASATAKPPEDTGEQPVDRAIDDYNQNYLPLHPELKDKPAQGGNDSKEDPAWIQFFEYINSKLPKPPPADRTPGSVGGVKG
jgi:tetratricopeptide (TPR) repeat protein